LTFYINPTIIILAMNIYSFHKKFISTKTTAIIANGGRISRLGGGRRLDITTDKDTL